MDCDVDYIRCILSMEKHWKSSKYDISNKWVIFRNYNIPFTVMVLIGNVVTPVFFFVVVCFESDCFRNNTTTMAVNTKS